MSKIMIHLSCLFINSSFEFIIKGFFSLAFFINVGLLPRLALFIPKCILALDALLLSCSVISFTVVTLIALFLVGLLVVCLFKIKIIMTFFISNISLCFSLFSYDASFSILILNLNLLLFLVLAVL